VKRHRVLVELLIYLVRHVETTVAKLQLDMCQAIRIFAVVIEIP